MPVTARCAGIDVRHLFLDSVIPLILSRREPLVLHASAILFDGRAIAFIGTSGQGKSTLAASHSQLGYSLISDDYLVFRHDLRTSGLRSPVTRA